MNKKLKITLAMLMMMTMVLLTSCTSQKAEFNSAETSQLSQAEETTETNQIVESSATQTDNEQTKVITHMKGTTEIPNNPKRLVDLSGSAEELDIIGVPYIACAQTSMFDGVTIPEHLKESFDSRGIETVGNWSGMTDINIERIVELQPDLIIMNAYSEKIYDQLCEIAPTVMLTDDYSYVQWRNRFLELGEWFDKEDVVEDWLKEYDDKAINLSTKVKEHVGNETFAVLERNSVAFGSYYIYGVSAGPGEIVFKDLNLNRTDITPADTWANVVDLESLAAVDADHIIFTSDDGTLGELEGNAVWNSLKKKKNKNVYLGRNSLQYDLAYTAAGKLVYMEKLANAIIEKHNIE